MNIRFKSCPFSPPPSSTSPLPSPKPPYPPPLFPCKMLNALAGVQIRPAPSTTVEAAKKKNMRGTGFSTAEEVALAQSCLKVNENPIVGAEKKEDDFYRAVSGVYHEKYQPANREVRTMESVRKRVSN
eukprot:gb/GEZJ01004617.1/.p3 GENE.gb/GEZJ01004617.1/~~gb/GEZJ01004617.1/.p3  ORF type:complete len:128 (+),score=19.45 gb/GEZJ01004617.1/:335-718(+)